MSTFTKLENSVTSSAQLLITVEADDPSPNTHHSSQSLIPNSRLPLNSQHSDTMAQSASDILASMAAHLHNMNRDNQLNITLEIKRHFLHDITYTISGL